MRRPPALLFACLALLPRVQAASLPQPDPDNAGLQLPAGFHAVVFADDLAAPRFLAVASNGDVYAKLNRGGIVALRDTDGDGRADQRAEIAAGAGTGIAIRGDYLYFSTNTAVLRHRRAPGELAPSGEPETIVSGLPDSYLGRRQHEAKAFAFDDSGHLVVEVGSPSNTLGNPDRAPNAKGSSDEVIAEFQRTHGGFWRFDAERPGQTQADGERVATGLRHALSIAWNPTAQAMFIAQNGRDVINLSDSEHFDTRYNAERVAEEFHLMRDGANFGWPYTYFDPVDHVRLFSPEYGGDGKKRPEPGRFQDPLIAFPAHWAPMQMLFYSGRQFPEKYRGGAFLAFHGSWNRAPEPQSGFNVCFVPFNDSGMPVGNYEVFADGFAGKDRIGNPREAEYRPQGLAQGPDGSLYIGADQGGRIWRVFHSGE